MPRPSFFLVGAPKCGTSSLCHYLRQHPEIFIPRKKELHFFAQDLELPRYFGSLDEYLDVFDGDDRQHAGEGTPWYLYSRTAAEEIRRFNPQAKVLISIRSPVDMVYSLFRFRRYTGLEQSKSLVEVLERERAYLSGTGKSDRITPNVIYAAAAMYTEQIGRFLDAFGPDNVHVVFFEELEGDPHRVYRGVLRFLGASEDFRPDFRNVNRTGRIRSERFQQRIAHLPPRLKRVAYAFPRAIRRPTYRALCRLNTSYAPPPPLEPDLRRRLVDQFRPDVERLGALLGRDLGHWVAP